MTTAQQLINQEINQGFNQSMEIKEIMIIKKGLQLSLNIETIAMLVDTSVQKVEEIIQKIKIGLL